MIPRQIIFDWLLLSALALLLGLSHGWAGVPDIDSKVYITIARNMIERNDWLIPFYHGKNFYLHPPLAIWLVAISFKIFGVSIYAARIPMALTLFGTTLLIYIIALWMRNRRTAFISGVLFCSMYPVMQIATKIHLDLPLTFFVTLSIVGIYFAQQISTKWYLITGIGTGLAILTKGLVGLAPLPILGLTLLFTRRLKDIFSPFLWSAIALSILIPYIWVVAMKAEGITWVSAYWTSGIQGVANIDFEGIKRGYLYFPKVFLLYLFPWSLFAIWQVVKNLYINVMPSTKRGGRLTKNLDRSWLIFLFTILVFIIAFSIPNYKLPHYLLPSLPAVAILAGLSISDVLSVKYQEALRSIAVIIIAVISFSLAIFPNPVRKSRSNDLIPLLPVIETIHKERGVKELAIIHINPPHHMPYWERVATMELYMPLPMELIFKYKRDDVESYFKQKRYALIEEAQFNEVSKFIPNLRILSEGNGLLLVSNSPLQLPPIHFKKGYYGRF